MNPDPVDVNARLKEAVKSAEVPPFLEARIRAHIQSEAALRRRWGFKLATTGAALAVAFGLTAAYQAGRLRFTAESQESYFASISARVGTLLRVGLGDHVHCAFFRKFPEIAPADEVLESSLGPEYKDLVSVVREYVPARYQLMLGHQCRYHNRRFVHLAMKDGSQLLSLIITAKNDGESFDVDGVLPALVQSGIPVYTGGVQRFQIAAIETKDHLAYFISDLPNRDNAQIMQAMAPQLKAMLEAHKG